jgi:hypothetical protein
MMLPPALLRMQISGSHSSWPRLWLPLFVLWPLFWVLFAFASACVVLALWLSAQTSVARALEMCTQAYALLCAVRGTHVDVVGARSRILIRVY